MSIIVKEYKDFEPAPDGSHAAVCVDVVDLGIVNGPFGDKHKVKIVWQIAEDRKDGKPFFVSRRYTVSLHAAATLRKDLESWRGRPFSKDELDGFELENLVGTNCLLSVMREDKFANVMAVIKLPAGIVRLKARDYVRVQDREPATRQRRTIEPSWDNIPSVPPEGSSGISDDIPF